MSEKKTNHSVSFEALSSLDAPVSFWKGIPFGLQHVMAMFVANLAPIFIVASAAKMTPAQSATIIQSGLLVAGLGTCLQLYGAWLIGSRLPMVTGISFTYVAAAVAICADKGYGAVVGAVMVGGLLELVLGLTAKYWRRFVPPIVSAIVVTSIGFSLLNVGATSFGGGSGAKDFGSWQNLTLGLISLVACLAFQLLMKGTAKQLSVLFGLVVGYVAAICMGKVDFSGFQHLAIFSLPQFMPFKPVFDPGSIISLALLYVVSSVEVLGDTAALTKVGLNRLPTERETAGAIGARDGRPDFVFHVFDYVATDVDRRYVERMGDLAALPESDRVVKVLPVRVDGPGALARYEEQCLAAGYEGVMVRTPDSPYKCGRSTEREAWLLKIKRFEDAEAVVLDTYEGMSNQNEAGVDAFGRTKRGMAQAGMVGRGELGGFVVRHALSGVEFRLGYNHVAGGVDRATLWHRRETLVGRLVKFKHQPSGAKDAPRFPKFVGFREAWDMGA